MSLWTPPTRRIGQPAGLSPAKRILATAAAAESAGILFTATRQPELWLKGFAVLVAIPVLGIAAILWYFGNTRGRLIATLLACQAVGIVALAWWRL